MKLCILIVLTFVCAVKSYSDLISPTFYCPSTDFCRKCGFKGHVECEDIGRGPQCVCVNGSVYQHNSCYRKIRDTTAQCFYDGDCKLPNHVCTNSICQCPKGTVEINEECVNKPLIGLKCADDTYCNPEKGIRCLAGTCQCPKDYLFYLDTCISYKQLTLNICINNSDCKTGHHCRADDNHAFGTCTLNKALFGETCDSDAECKNGQTKTVCYNGTCICDQKLIWNGEECVSKSTCSTDQDCKITGSYCHHEDSTCKCRSDSILLNNTHCVKKHKSIGDYCMKNADCSVGYCRIQQQDYWGICSCLSNTYYNNGNCNVLKKTTEPSEIPPLRLTRNRNIPTVQEPLISSGSTKSLISVTIYLLFFFSIFYT